MVLSSNYRRRRPKTQRSVPYSYQAFSTAARWRSTYNLSSASTQTDPGRVCWAVQDAEDLISLQWDLKNVMEAITYRLEDIDAWVEKGNEVRARLKDRLFKLRGNKIRLPLDWQVTELLPIVINLKPSYY